MSDVARGGETASAAVVKRLAVLLRCSGVPQPVPRYISKFARLNHGLVRRSHPLAPDTLTLHPPFVAHHSARFSLTLYGTDMTEPLTPKLMLREPDAAVPRRTQRHARLVNRLVNRP